MAIVIQVSGVLPFLLLAQIVEAIGGSLGRASTLALEIVDIISIEEAS